jgi:hypothetical protein
LFIGQLVGIDRQLRIDHLCGFLNHFEHFWEVGSPIVQWLLLDSRPMLS